MVFPRKQIFRFLSPGLVAVFLLVPDQGIGQPPDDHSELLVTEPNVFRVVLRLDFSARREQPEIHLLDFAPKRGRLPSRTRTVSLVRSRFVEIREGAVMPFRYSLKSIDGKELDAGHFLVSRLVHAEKLDPRTGKILEHVRGTVDEVTTRISIPFHPEAVELEVSALKLSGPRGLDQAPRAITRNFPLPLPPEEARGSTSIERLSPILDGPVERVWGDGSPGRFNLVIMGDGFTKGASLEFYRAEVTRLVGELRRTHPFGRLEDAINIYRLDVKSGANGIDVPSCSDRPEQLRDNALETRFCGVIGGQAKFNFITSANASLILELADLASGPNVDDYVLVLANDQEFGGGGFWNDGIAYYSVASTQGGAPDDCSGLSCELFPWDDSSLRERIRTMAIHEFGHAAFDLGDEYCRHNISGDTSMCDATISFTGAQPFHPNVTKWAGRVSPLAGVQWAGLIQPKEISIPTHRVTGCPGVSVNNPSSPELPKDLVGLFEGALNSVCGIYRPRDECRMNTDTNKTFCPVCRDQIVKTLAPYLPNHLRVILDTVHIKNAPDQTGSLEVHYKVSVGGQTRTSSLATPQSPADSKLQILEAPGSPLSNAPNLKSWTLDIEETLISIPVQALSVLAGELGVEFEIIRPDGKPPIKGSFTVPSTSGVHVVSDPDDLYRVTLTIVSGS